MKKIKLNKIRIKASEFVPTQLEVLLEWQYKAMLLATSPPPRNSPSRTRAYSIENGTAQNAHQFYIAPLSDITTVLLL